MIEIIPVSKRKPGQDDTATRFYIEDTENLSSIAEKYNWAIDNIIMKSNDDVICFRHDDTEFRTPRDIIEAQVRKQWANGAGVCGVIGTIALEGSCQWWTPNRHFNGSGYIIQGGIRPKQGPDGKPLMAADGTPIMERYEYPMDDHPGVHDYLATIDGCCFWVNKKMFKEGVRFDNNLKGYHFYDTDICCQALERHYKVSTINVVVKHDSEGQMPKDFDKLREIFFNKWNAKIDTWPITRYTKFK